MSTGQTYNQAPAPISVVGLHIRCDETFETRLPRPWRLRLYERRLNLRRPLESTNDLTSEERGKLAQWLDALKRNPPRREAALRAVAAELAPDPALIAASVERIPAAAEPTDRYDQLLSFAVRIGDGGHEGRLAAGDIGNRLLARNPFGRRADVLGEFLREDQAERFKAFLCPKLPWVKNLTPEDRLRNEETAVDTLSELARVAERVPQRLRDEHPDLAFELIRISATAREFRDGRWRIPSEAEIERRLNAASDDRGQFKTLEAFKQWCRTGTVEAKPRAEKPDHVDEALAHFRGRYYELDSIVQAWAATFGPGAPYGIREGRR